MAVRWRGLLPGWGVVGFGIVLCGIGVGLPTHLIWRGRVEDGPLRPAMVVVPAGTFRMGSEEFDDEKPIHEVKLSAFAISVTEVTQGQYQRVMEERPSAYKGDDNLPVERVSWFDAVRYANRLSELEKLPGCYRIQGEEVSWVQEPKCGYRLPTEAEWEYAARAGQQTKYAGSDGLDEVAWHDDRETHPVGTKKTNAWGLHDMSGNVWEWVWDWYGGYAAGPLQQDPRGPERGSDRVHRGGSFAGEPQYLLVANRGWHSPDFHSRDLGFRLVRSLP